MIKIGFITGARSEYGVMKPLIRALVNDDRFEVTIVATGMHYLQRYGDTIDEIRRDELAPIIDAPCYSEQYQEKKDDFVGLINALYDVFNDYHPDIIYLIGDRLEAYAAALVAHFKHIPVAHYAGGQITEGAVDNIYRYNISNLSTLHFVTNKFAEIRLKSIPTIDEKKVYFVGSTAIDAIYDYLRNPQDASVIDKKLRRGNYVLMTFHPETQKSKDGDTIPIMMDNALRILTDSGMKVLITYPNNDDGAEDIISVIERWVDNPMVIVKKNLGSQIYYVAVDNAQYIIGNSSSAIIEVPYFQKYSVDVGIRQQGRNHPKSVLHINNDCEELKIILQQLHRDSICKNSQEYIYGNGNSVTIIPNLIYEYFNKYRYV